MLYGGECCPASDYQEEDSVADLAITESNARDMVSEASFVYPGVCYSEKGLSLPDDLPYEAWANIGDTLHRVHKSIQWAVADWLNFGETHYPDRYTQALEATHYEERESLHNIAYVGRQFPNGDMRHDALTFTHHQEVASLPPDVREELLTEAELSEPRMTTRELRSKAIEHRQLLKDGRPTWTVIAEATSDEWLELETADGEVAQVSDTGSVWFMDAAGRKWLMRDMDKFIRNLYALKQEAQRHFGTWPKK